MSDEEKTTLLHLLSAITLELNNDGTAWLCVTWDNSKVALSLRTGHSRSTKQNDIEKTLVKWSYARSAAIASALAQHLATPAAEKDAYGIEFSNRPRPRRD